MHDESVNYAVVKSVIGDIRLSKMADLAVDSANFEDLVKACGYVQVVPGAEGSYMALYVHEGMKAFGPLATMPEKASRKYAYIQTNSFDGGYLLREIYDILVENVAARYGLEKPASK